MAINNYVDLATVKAYMPENEVSTTTNWDTFVTNICPRLSRMFDTYTRREPGAYCVTDDDTRWFDGIPLTATDYTTMLWVDEIAAAPTTVIVGDDTWLSSDYIPGPYNAVRGGKPFRWLMLAPNGPRSSWGNTPHSIQITGKFGYSTATPADIQEALLLFVVRMVRKAQQNYLETGTILDSGQVMIMAKRDEELSALIQNYKKGKLVQ